MRALITFCACALALAFACAPSKPSVPLNAAVNQSATGIKITNGSKTTYKDVTVTINYGESEEYAARVDHIWAGEDTIIPYSEFLNASNGRFNYGTTAVARVMVRARIGDVYTWEEFK